MIFRMNNDMKDKDFGLSFKSFVILHKHIKELIKFIELGKKDEETFQYVKKMFVSKQEFDLALIELIRC